MGDDFHGSGTRARSLAPPFAECDENLCGTKLTPAERALFTRRRKEAYEALHPETRAHVAGAHAANAAMGNASANLAPAFTADTAVRTNQSERVVQRDATRGERIAEWVRLTEGKLAQVAPVSSRGRVEGRGNEGGVRAAGSAKHHACRRDRGCGV